MGVRDDDAAAKRWATIGFLLALGGCIWAIVVAVAATDACQRESPFGGTERDEACVQGQLATAMVALGVGVVGIVIQGVVAFRSGRQGAGIVTMLSFAFLPLFIVGYIMFLAMRPVGRPPSPAYNAPPLPHAAPAAPAGLAPSPWSGGSSPEAAIRAPDEESWKLADSQTGSGRALSMQRRLARIKAAHTDLDLTQANLLLERFENGDEASGSRLDAVLAGMEDGLQYRRAAAPSVTYHDARTVAGDLVQGGKVMSEVRDSVVTGNVASAAQDPRCVTCGGALSASAKFCHACGAAQPSAGKF